MWSLTERDRRLVRYLLGKLSEEERDLLEEEYFADDSLHEQLLALEEELIDAYVRGRLSPGDSARFEQRFLNSPERRDKVEFARALAARVEQAPAKGAFPRASWWEKLLRLFRSRTPAMRLAFATVGVVVAMTSVVILTRRTGEPAPGSRAGRPVAEPVRPALPVLSFALASVERGAGRENRLEIPPGEYEIRLQADLDSDDRQSYRARLETAEGKRVGEFADLRVETSATGRRSVAVTLRSSLLDPGHYILRLYAVSPDGTAEETGTYSFELRKRGG